MPGSDNAGSTPLLIIGAVPTDFPTIVAMAKVKPSAAPKKSTTRTEAVHATGKSKPEDKAVVKPKMKAKSAPLPPAAKAPAKKVGKKADKAEKHVSPVLAPTPKVQAEAHETQEKIRELIKLARNKDT